VLIDYGSTREAADPYCLRDGEAAALLAGHPWRRFVVLGDSVAAGIGDFVEGYIALPWVDRIAAELAARQPDLVYRNLGRRNRRAARVRLEQLPEAVDLAPDLALVACGANDAIDPRYDPAPVDEEITAMVGALRERGADVLTVGVLVLPRYPGLPADFAPGLTERLRLLGRRTRALSARLGTIHIDLTDHPAGDEPDLHSADGVHGNGRTHAISAAEAVRRLGAHLGNTYPAS
jgi:lysophospholipase L1-like esterase